MRQQRTEIEFELIELVAAGSPTSDDLARLLHEICAQNQIRIMLLDGPQGWKADENEHPHSRVCEKLCNTPAKTGLPGIVKPGNYAGFVVFSIDVFNCLERLGWKRLARIEELSDPSGSMLVESFPLSAWKWLGIPYLPAKSKAKPDDIEMRLRWLRELYPIRLMTGIPSHDQLQALVSGLGGLALESLQWNRCTLTGLPPAFDGGHWREGFIVNPARGIRPIGSIRDLASCL